MGFSRLLNKPSASCNLSPFEDAYYIECLFLHEGVGGDGSGRTGSDNSYPPGDLTHSLSGRPVRQPTAM